VTTRAELLTWADAAAIRTDELLDNGDGAAYVYELRALRLTIAASIAGSGEEERSSFEQWAEVELMGHRNRIARVREIEIGHRTFLELHCLNDQRTCATCGYQHAGSTRTIGIHGEHEFAAPDEFTIEVYSPSAVFCLTPITEEAARQQMAPDELTRREEIPF
jgi:hypothetical protein